MKRYQKAIANFFQKVWKQIHKSPQQKTKQLFDDPPNLYIIV